MESKMGLTEELYGGSFQLKKKLFKTKKYLVSLLRYFDFDGKLFC